MKRSQNEVLMGDVGDAIIRGGNPNDPNFGKAPANGKSYRGTSASITFHSASSRGISDAVKDGLEKRGLRARVDTGNTGDISTRRPTRATIPRRPTDTTCADKLRHQGYTADRIELDEAGTVGGQRNP